MSDLENMQQEARQREKAYRRGWHQGWAYACEVIVDNLLAIGMTPEEINKQVSAFESRYIMPWRAGQSQDSQRPTFQVMNLQDRSEEDEDDGEF